MTAGDGEEGYNYAEKEERAVWWIERSSTGLLFFSGNTVPIKRTDVHLCNKLQTHLALGAIASLQCVRISHS